MTPDKKASDENDTCRQLNASLPAPAKDRTGKEPGRRVAVCMSGGVDSSCTALLLQQQGYDVVGVTAWLIKSGSRCCDTGIIDAARVCEQLAIEHHAVDLREAFKAEVIDNFPRAYAQARTPVPCCVCNTFIKWGALLEYGLNELSCDYIATGHYARLIQDADGPRLGRSADRQKDQSYVLWGLTAEQLKRTILPLGDYTKEEIRRLAAAHNLASASRQESQDLCFIPEGTSTQEYLALHLAPRPGPIIHLESKEVLGEHQGIHNYTVGQRRGLGVAYSEPLYVTSVDAGQNIVYVGTKDHLLRTELTASCVNWILGEPVGVPFEALAKIRYNSPVKPAVIYPLPDRRVKVVFAEPQPAITAGQVLGIYDTTDTYILGGGWID
jgi:tRNA-uridine 2-sulfurtransferase